MATINPKQLFQWLLVYLLPYLLIVGVTTISTGKGLGGRALDNPVIIFKTIFVPIVSIPSYAFEGYVIGFSSSAMTAPAYTLGFKFFLFAFLASSMALFVLGIVNRDKLWGKIINALGFYIWCLGGIIAFAPSA